MPITSISQFLKPETQKLPEFLQSLQLILRGVSLHIGGEDAERLARFRSRFDGLAQALTEQSTSQEISSVVNTAIGTLQDYTEVTSASRKALIAEMQAMLGMMSSTIAFLAASSEKSVAQLNSIQQQLEIAAGIEDVKAFRLQLSDCLVAVRNESTRIRETSEERIQVLEKGIERTSIRVPAARTNDRETGLRARGQAENMIESIIQEKKDVTAALFQVERLPYLTTRYGRKVADEIVLMVAGNLKQKLPENLMPLRWSAHAFLVVLDTSAFPTMTERKLKYIGAERLEKHIEADGRSLMLPVSCSVVMHKISSGDSAEATFRALDKLANASSDHL